MLLHPWFKNGCIDISLTHLKPMLLSYSTVSICAKTQSKGYKNLHFSIKNWQKTDKKRHFLSIFRRKMGIF
nr:hypothetical protein [Mucilaginibacter sp. E4BP6]